MKFLFRTLAFTLVCLLFFHFIPANGQENREKEPRKSFPRPMKLIIRQKRDLTVIKGEDLAKILAEHERWLTTEQKEGQQANLSKADLFNAILPGYNLSKANLRGADLSGADLREANLNNAVLSFANLANSDFEPKNIEGLIFLGVRGFSSIRFRHFKPVVELRKKAKESGLRNEERALTAALRKYRLKGARFHLFGIPLSFDYFLLDLPTDSGANPWRSLVVLCGLILVFSIPYTLALKKRGKDGIYQIWIPERVRKDLGYSKPIRLYYLRGLSEAWRTGFHFSLLSAFHIGWRELNVGNWIARIQRREYNLRATGWVRSVSGIQSLLSVYLLALWALTYFGRPFE